MTEMTEKTEDKVDLYSVDAEQHVLGTLLNNNNYYYKIDSTLRAEYFYDSSHQRIFNKIISLMNNGLVADFITMKNFADKDEGLKDVGGGKYITKISSVTPQLFNLKSYVKEIHDYYVKRNVKSTCEEIVEKIDGGGDNDINVDLLQLESDLQDIETSQRTKDAVNLHDVIDQVNNSIGDGTQEARRSISTKFINLDNIIGGLARSNLVILGGRPSMGKTAFAINLALNTAEELTDRFQGKKSAVGFFSLEMSAEELGHRVMAIATEINMIDISRGNLSPENIEKLKTCNDIFEDVELVIDDTPALDIDSLRARARKMKKKNNVEVIIVDYLQLMRGSSKLSQQSQNQQITEISQGLKAIAKELDVPVLALAQLNRAVEMREDKRPTLADLRDSGSIEQDADIVMFIYRAEYYLQKEEPNKASAAHDAWKKKMNGVKGLTSLMIRKNRQGPTGECALKFDGTTQRFNDY